MQKLLPLLLLPLPLLLTACMSDAGIKASYLMNKQQSTHTSVAFGKLRVNEEIPGSYKAFLGEYKVEESWDNNVFHIDKVVIEEKNNKIIAYSYPQGWQIPNQKTEFTGCQVVNNSGHSDYGFNNTEQTLICLSTTGNAFKGYSSMQVVKTTDNTIGKVKRSGAILNALMPQYDVSIKTPYAIELNLWDESQPVLAVKKEK